MSRPYVSTYFSPNRGAADQIIGFIDHCHETLDIAVYSVTHDEIADAIIRAHQRGVAVRVLTDAVQASNRYADDEKLEAAGIPLRRDTQAGSMHNKFCLGDVGTTDRAVITGSFNWSANADRKNAENFVIVRLSYAVADFQEEFDRLWALNA
jgi:cardiolipin hydrolase